MVVFNTIVQNNDSKLNQATTYNSTQTMVDKNIILLNRLSIGLLAVNRLSIGLLAVNRLSIGF